MFNTDLITIDRFLQIASTIRNLLPLATHADNRFDQATGLTVKDVHGMIDAVETAQATADPGQIELDEMKAQIATLTGERDKLQADLQQSQAGYTELLAKAGDLEKENADMKAQLAAKPADPVEQEDPNPAPTDQPDNPAPAAQE